MPSNLPAGIYVESLPVLSGSGQRGVLGLNHAYLVYRDGSGGEFVIRGGPSNEGLTASSAGWGSINVEAGIPLANSEDRYVGNDSSESRNARMLDLGGRDPAQVWSQMVNGVTAVGAANIPYLLTAQNSNSVVCSLLEANGIPVTSASLPVGVSKGDLLGCARILKEVFPNVQPAPQSELAPIFASTQSNPDGSNTNTVTLSDGSLFTFTYGNAGGSHTTRADYSDGDIETARSEAGNSHHSIYDTATAQTQSGVVDSAGRVTSATTVYANAESDVTVYDAANTQAWSEFTTRYNTSGQSDHENSDWDDGRSRFYDWDQSSTQAWTTAEVWYDAQNRADYQWVNQDNGTSRYDDWDQAGTQSWSSYSSIYDTAGRSDYQNVFLDDNRSHTYDWDQDNSQGWATTDTYWDAQGRLDYQWVDQDVGTRYTTDWDQGGTEVWNSFQMSYDSTGAQDWLTISNDSASTDYYDWDTSGAYSWTFSHAYYDGSGNLGWADTVWDDSSWGYGDYNSYDAYGSAGTYGAYGYNGYANYNAFNYSNYQNYV